MRYLIPNLTLALLAVLTMPVIAQQADNPGDQPDRPGREEMRERMLKEHDKDGDGELSDEERKAARDAMRERMLKEHDKDGDGILSDEERKAARASMRERFGRGGEHARHRREQGARTPRGDRGTRDERGPRGRDRGPDGLRARHGPGGHMGGPPLPPPDELFKQFDADNNDSLSREEFMKLADFVKEHRPPGPPPGGQRFDRGPDGPPRDEFRHRGFGPDDPPRGDRPGPRDRDDRDRPPQDENAEEAI